MVTKESLDTDFRRIDVTTGGETKLEPPIQGFILTSHDGSTTLLVGSDPSGWRLWVADDHLVATRLLFEAEEPGSWAPFEWSPDGRKIAGLARVPGPGPSDFEYEIRVIDIVTSAVTVQRAGSVEGQLIWLPKD